MLQHFISEMLKLEIAISFPFSVLRYATNQHFTSHLERSEMAQSKSAYPDGWRGKTYKDLLLHFFTVCYERTPGRSLRKLQFLKLLRQNLTQRVGLWKYCKYSYWIMVQATRRAIVQNR